MGYGKMETKIQEMMERYQIKYLPIEKCPIFSNLKGVLCGNCSLLPVCKHGKNHIANFKKYNQRLKGES